MQWAKLSTAFGSLGLVLLLAVNAVPAAAQTGSVQGVVRDANSGGPLAGVQILLVGTRLATTTDQEGRYTLANVPLGTRQIRARMLGYSSAVATVSVSATVAVALDFALPVSVIVLDEVVVTGAGAAVERKQLGNTIATIRADQIENAPVQSFSEAIAGREAGVEILPSGGLAGEGSRIKIRGVQSLSQSNQPVVYVDGVRVDNGGGLVYATTGGGGHPSTLDDINPETIERVEILKGAAAATLYGSEANSGVIQIFTKKGSRGDLKFDFRLDRGFSTYPDVFKPNAGFARYATQADCEAAGNTAAACRSSIGVADRLSALYGTSLEPFQVFERPFVQDLFGQGLYQSYSGNMSGGGDIALFNVAGRFMHDDGPMDATHLGLGASDRVRRINGSANLTLFPRERFQIRVGTMYADTHQEIPQNNNNIYGVISSTIFGKPEVSNCEQSRLLELGGEFGEDPARPGFCAGPGNPFGQTAFGTTREAAQLTTGHDAEHFNGNMTLSYEAARDLNLDVTFGLDISNQQDANFLPFGNNLDRFSTRRPGGFRIIGTGNRRELSLDAKARWNRDFGMLSSNLVVGTQGFINRSRFRGGQGLDFPGPGLEVAGAGANQNVFESFSQVVNLGIMAQEQIGINDWAFVTVGGRLDRNSAFGENEPSAFYPKASVSIIPSDLPGWGSRFLSTFRVRAAIGRSGRQPGAFDKLTTFGALPSELGPGLQPSNLGNPDLKPEVAVEWEAGAELAVFNNTVAFDVTRWHRTTRDALVSRQFPVTGGFLQTQLDNIGELEGEGWDLKVSALVIDGPNVSMNVFASGAYLKQRILSMGGAPPIKIGGSYPRYRQFLIGPDTLYDGTVNYWAPATFFGAQLLPTCGSSPVYTRDNDARGITGGTPRPCWTPGETVPFDVDGDGLPDSEAAFRAYLAGVPAGGLDGAALSPLRDDEDGDGDLFDHYAGKPTPDWTGAFGATITVVRRFELRSLFEYKTGQFFVSNLTDAFRKANPLIGRNIREAAEIEATMLNPASTADQRFDAAMLWATQYKALSPYDGMNQIENAKFIRWRELSLTYTAPTSFANRFGLDNVALNLSGRNIALFSPYTGIDPELNAVSLGGGDQFLDGEEAFGVPIPRRWTFSVRFSF